MASPAHIEFDATIGGLPRRCRVIGARAIWPVAARDKAFARYALLGKIARNRICSRLRQLHVHVVSAVIIGVTGNLDGKAVATQRHGGERIKQAPA